jgi:AraC family transcriptional regulator, transcriptional activator of pobA
MKKDNPPYKIESLAELHRLLGLPKPMHPLISLINNLDGQFRPNEGFPDPFILSFYKITYQPNLRGQIRYGQQYYDFDEGGLFFIAPNQVSGTRDKTLDFTGFTLFIHPDFIQPYPLAKTIKTYGFFSYATSEMLHLSEQEKETVLTIARSINEELKSRIDDCSQDVLIAQLELLLSYANRFYKRQFITRKAVNHQLLQKLDDLLDHHFDAHLSLNQGIPTVQYIAQQLNVSPSYLSDLLRFLLGHNAQQHIHQKLIEKAKEKLSTTSLSVSQIAYELGFEHPQSFSTLFKSKTNLSPLAYRQSFN